MKSCLLSILIFLTMLSGSMAQQFVAQDDPIAAALDSLATKKVLDKLYAKPVSLKNKFSYAPDSIPRFDSQGT